MTGFTSDYSADRIFKNFTEYLPIKTIQLTEIFELKMFGKTDYY